MELKITELDEHEDYPDKYWEQATTAKQKQERSRKKRVSFNDILSNMNIVVNQAGVLQFMAPTQELLQEYNPPSMYDTQYPQEYPQEYIPQQQHQSAYTMQNVKQPEPIPEAVKKSPIYNKYFKDYHDVHTPAPTVRVPKTMEEYKQMLLEDRIKEIEQKQRISEIKSKKLLFTAPPFGGTKVNPTVRPSNNSLRSMSFH